MKRLIIIATILGMAGISFASNLPLLYRSALGVDDDRTKVVYKFGFNAAASTSEEAIWTHSTTYAYISSAADTLTISSSSTTDDAAASGARTVTIYGLDSDYNEQSEIVSLNGNSGVSSANKYKRINRIIVNFIY